MKREKRRRLVRRLSAGKLGQPRIDDGAGEAQPSAGRPMAAHLLRRHEAGPDRPGLVMSWARDRQGYLYVGGAVLTGAVADGAGAAVEYGALVGYGAVGEV